MTERKITLDNISIDEVKQLGKEVGIDWETSKFTVESFKKGLEVELEHGTINSSTNITDDDPIATAKIALAHLNELPDYYERLEKVESSDANTESKNQGTEEKNS